MGFALKVCELNMTANPLMIAAFKVGSKDTGTDTTTTIDPSYRDVTLIKVEGKLSVADSCSTRAKTNCI